MMFISAASGARSQSQILAPCASDAPVWTCSACAVRVSFAPGFTLPSDLPDGWIRDGELRCLACCRAAVAEAAKAAGGDPKVIRRAIRHALVAFEWRRTPDASAREITKRTGGSLTLVAEVRSDLVAAGELEAAAPRPPVERPAKRTRTVPRTEPTRRARRKRRSLADRHPELVAELRRDPRRTNPQIADAAGMTASTFAGRRQIVRAVRLALEQAGEISVYRATGGTPHHRQKVAA